MQGNESLVYDGVVNETSTVQSTLELPVRLTKKALKNHKWYVINGIVSQPRIQVPTDLNPGPMKTQTYQVNTAVTSAS